MKDAWLNHCITLLLAVAIFGLAVVQPVHGDDEDVITLDNGGEDVRPDIADPEDLDLDDVDLEPPTRDVRFQFDGVTYMHVVRRFADMMERPLLVETEINGELTFSDPDPYTYEEALDALNLILETRGAALIDERRFLRLVPLDDIERTQTRIFRGLPGEDDARPGEIVTVVLSLEHIEAADVLEAAQTMLSPAGAIAPMTRESGIIITDRLSSIERIQRLLDEVDTESAVQRTMRTYTLLTAPGAVVSDLVNQTFGEATAPRRLQYNRRQEEYQELSPNPEDYVTAIFDEPSRTLILFGPRDRIEMAESLIDQFEDESGRRAGEVMIFYPGTQTADQLAQIVRQAVPGIAGPNQQADATQARVIVDNATERLIVTAPAASQLEEIERVIMQVDEAAQSHQADEEGFEQTPPDRLAVTRVFELGDADAQTVEEAVRHATTTTGPGNRQRERVNLTLDTDRNRLVVSGAPGDVELAGEIIEQIKTDEPYIPRQTRLVPVANDEEVQRLLPLVTDLYQEQLLDQPRRRTPEASIMPDPGNGRLIVVGTDDDIEQIEQLVEALRLSEPPKARRFSVVALEQVQIDDVLADLQSLVDEAMDAPHLQEPAAPSLMGDQVNNRLFVTATDDQLEVIQEIIQTLDVRPQQQRRQLFMVDLAHATADQVIPLVQELYDQIDTTRPDDQPAPVLRAHTQDDRIIVLATEDDYEQIASLIDEFDHDEPTEPRETRTVELPDGEPADELQSLVADLYQEQTRGETEPAGGFASINTDRSNRRLIFTGTEPELARLEAIVEQVVDRAEHAADEPQQTRVYRLQQARATEIEGLLNASLNEEDEQIVRVLVDEPSNSLILSGTDANLEVAEYLIDELDQRPHAAPRRLRLMGLEEAEATQIEPLISAIFEQMMLEQHGPNYEVQTRIFADGGSNRIVVLGPENEIEHIADLVQELDVGDPRATEPSEVFEIEHADAGNVAQIIRDAIGGDEAEASVTSDADTNTVIVSGSDDDIRAARRIIQGLDTPAASRSERELRFVEVDRDRAASLASLAADLWQEQAGDRRHADEVAITADADNHRLIVIAPEDHADAVEQLIESLGRRTEAAERKLHRLTIERDTVDQVLPRVQELYDEQAADEDADRPARLIAGPTPRHLFVVGSDAQADRVQQILEALQVDEPAPQRTTEYIEFASSRELNRLLPMIEQLYEQELADAPALGQPDASFLTDSERARVIVTAREDHIERIQAIVAELRDDPEATPSRQTRLFSVGRAEDVQRVEPLLQQMYQDQLADDEAAGPADASIIADPNGGRLIVTARPEHLERIEQILEQIQDGQPDDDSPRVTRVYDLEAARAVSLAQTLTQLYEEHARDRSDAEADRVLILPDEITNRLIVTAPEGEIAQVEQILEDLDRVTEQSGDARVFRLESADAEQVATLLTQTMTQPGAAPWQQAQPRISVGADPRANILIVSGDPEDLQAAAMIIDQLDGVAETRDRDLRIFELQSENRTDEIAQQAEDLYTDQLSSRAERGVADAQIIADAHTNRLIVTAVVDHLDLIEEIVEKLDESGRETGRQIRVLSVNTSAGSLVGVINEMLADRVQAATPAERLIITPAPDDRALVINAPRQTIERVEELVAILDDSDAPRQLETRSYAIPGADAQELAPLLARLFEAESPDATRQPQFEPGPVNQVIVAATEDQFERIENLIEMLEDAPAEFSSQVKTFTLQHADPREVEQIIQQMLGPDTGPAGIPNFMRAQLLQQQYLQSGEDLTLFRVTAAPAISAVVVQGSRQHLALAEQLIENLDAPVEERRDRLQVRSYRIPDGDVAQLAPTLATIFAEQDTDDTTPQPRFEADPARNTIFIAATADQFERIEQIVDDLQEPAEVTRRVETFTLQHADPVELQQVLEQMLSEGPDLSGMSNWQRMQMLAATGASDDEARVTAAPALNAVIVQGRPPQLALAQELIENLDVEADDHRRLEIRAYTLPDADVTQLAPTLASLFADQAPRGPQPRFEADAASNSIIIAATDQQFPRIEALIDDLQEPAELAQRTETFTLEHADPLEVQQVLQEMLTDEPDLSGMSGWQRAQVMAQMAAEGAEVRITVAPAINAVIVQGRPAHLSLAEQLIENMDVEVERHRRLEIRAYAIREADVTELAPTLASLFAEEDTPGPQPRFEADPGSRKIMVAATADQFPHIEELIESLQEPVEPAQRIETFRLTHADPGQMQQVLSEMLSDSEVDLSALSNWQRRQIMAERAQSDEIEPRVTAARQINSVIVQGSAAHIAAAEQLIEMLDVEPDADDPFRIRAFTIAEGDVAELAPMLERLFEDHDTTGPEPRFEATGRRVVVGAPESQFPEIEEVIASLQETIEFRQQVRSFELEHADARRVQDMLREMLSDEVDLDGLPNWQRRQILQQQQESDDIEVRVIAMPAINSVIVQGSTAQLALAEQLIETVDHPERDGAVVMRTVPLERARAESLASAVTDAIAARDVEFPQDQVSVTPEVNSNSLLISGPDHAVETIIDMVRELDERGTPRGIDVRIFRIQHGEADEISSVLQDMLDGVFDGQPLSADDVTVTVDARTNSLLISGEAGHFEFIEQLLAALDDDDIPDMIDRQIRYVRLDQADPFDVAANIRQLFQHRPQADRPVIEANLFDDSITAIGRQRDLDRITEMIAELDDVSRDTTVQIRMLPLVEVPAEQMAQMLRDVHSQMTDARVELVDTLPRPHRGAEPVDDPDALIDDLDLEADADLDDRALVAITYDRNSNTLMLSGPGYELDALESLVNELSFSFVSTETDFRRFELEHADPEAVAETLTQLFREEPVEIVMREGEEQEVRRPQQQITVIPEPRTRSVMVRARPTHFEVVEALIEQLDADGVPPQTQMRIFALQHVAPDRLVSVVEEMIEHVQQTRPGDAMSVHVDEASRSLVVIGREQLFDQVAEVIEQFDTEQTLTEADIQFVQLTQTPAPVMATTLNEMLQPTAEGQLTPEARALQEQIRKLNIQDEDGNRAALDLTQPIKVGSNQAANFLIFTSTPDNMPALLEVARMMDRLPLTDSVDVRLIVLERADAQTVQNTIENIFTQGQQLAIGPAGPAQPEGESGEALTADLNVAADPRTNTVILSGHPAALDLAENLITDLDQDIEQFVTEVELFRLRHASAQNLAPLLQSVFAEDAGGDPSVEGLATHVTRLRRELDNGDEALTDRPSSRAALTVQADDVTNTLVVAARSDMMPLISDVVETMDVPESTGMDNIRIMPLDYADAENVQQTIEDLYDGPLASQMPAADRPHITVDLRTNALIIAGNDKIWGVLAGLIQQLDKDLPGETIRAFTLQHVEAQRAAATIESLIDQGIYRPGAAAGGAQQDLAEEMAVEVNARANTLIVSASPQNMTVVERVIEQLDNEARANLDADDDPDMRVYVLEHAAAPRLVNTLEDFLEARRDAEQIVGEATRPVSIVADQRTNALLVSGGVENFNALERLIRQLDVPNQTAESNYRIFDLQHSTAASVHQQLEQLIHGRPTADNEPAPQPVTIIPDPWTNTLMIAAAAEDMPMVASLVERLDGNPDDDADGVTMFRLRKADAEQVANTIESLYDHAGGDVAINVDERINAILVSAGSADTRRIGRLVEELDTEEVARVAEIRVLQLRHARAPDLADLLDDLLSASPTAPGETAPSHQRLLQFVTRSTDETGERNERIASALQEGVHITADTRTNALVISAPVEAMPMLEDIISRLDASSPQIASIRVFTLENADAEQMAQVLQELFRLQETAAEERSIRYTLVRSEDEFGNPATFEDSREAPATLGTAEQHALTVTVDQRTNSLLIGGTEHYVRLATELINELDTSPGQERISRVYRLRYGQASDIQPAVRDFLDQERERVTQILGEEGIGTVQRLLDREISIVAEEASNTLLLSANPRYFDEIATLIEELDQPLPQVLIQVMLAEVTLDEQMDLGMEWRYTPVIDGTPVEMGTDFGVQQDLATDGGFFTMISGGDVQFLLRALQASGRLEVLSRPQIVAVDNMEAQIVIGSEVPIVTGVDTAFGATERTRADIEYRDVGITLDVLPRITPNGFVNITVMPEVSSLSAQTVQVSEDFAAPIIDSRSAVTDVTVKDGNTIVIGGLIETRDELIEDKVPFLGDLPLIGAAFRSTSNFQQRTELLIILTPHIIRDVADANRMTRRQLSGSSIYDMPVEDDDHMRRRLMDELGEEGSFRHDPENGTGFEDDDFRPVRHELYERDTDSTDADAPGPRIEVYEPHTPDPHAADVEVQTQTQADDFDDTDDAPRLLSREEIEELLRQQQVQQEND